MKKETAFFSIQPKFKVCCNLGKEIVLHEDVKPVSQDSRMGIFIITRINVK